MVERDITKVETRKEGRTFPSRYQVPCPKNSHPCLTPDPESDSADTKGTHPHKVSLPTNSYPCTDSTLASIYNLAHFYQNLPEEKYSPGQCMARRMRKQEMRVG